MTDWKDIFQDWYKPLEKYGCVDLLDGLERDLGLLYENSTVYPKSTNIFRAFRECGYDMTKVVLLGMDPYHNLYKGEPSACGLCFATENGYSNPSLRIITEEMKNDIGYQGRHKPESENSKLKDRLLQWPQEGVLMLNAALTVEKGLPGSHKKVWEEWTKRFVSGFSRDRYEIPWMLWGKNAQAFKEYMPQHEELEFDTHYGKFNQKPVTFERPHPMVDIYSGKRIFRDSNVFSEVNKMLKKNLITKIKW